jgi:hypothetical protein
MWFVSLIGGLMIMNDLGWEAVIGWPQLISTHLSGQAKGVGVINLGTCTGLLGVMAMASRSCHKGLYRWPIRRLRGRHIE